MVLTAKLLTELVGTFIFLSVIALSGPVGALAPLPIGGALMVVVYMGGHVSGAHYNPAVSLGVFLRGKLTSAELILYWVAQVAGAIVAFAFGYAVSGSTPGLHPGSNASVGAALAVEVAFTAALVLVVLNAAATKATAGNSFYGLAIGFTVAVGAFVAGPISGGSFNPAVGFGAILGGAWFAGQSWSYLWLYLVAPLIGAAIAAGIHRVQLAGLEAEAALSEMPSARAEAIEG